MSNKTKRDPRDAFPWSVKEMPLTLTGLIGRKVRIVRSGDVVTQDFKRGRVTIFISDAHRIEDIKIEPGGDTE